MAMPPTMRKKTVKLPGSGNKETELFFGPGFVAIDDLGEGSANVIAQGYDQDELIAAFAEGRAPVPVTTHGEPLTGQAYQDFKASHPAFQEMLVTVAWEVLESPRNVGDSPAEGDKDTRVNFFAGSVKTYGPGADVKG